MHTFSLSIQCNIKCIRLYTYVDQHSHPHISLTDTDSVCSGYQTCETFCSGGRRLFDYCESHRQFQFHPGLNILQSSLALIWVVCLVLKG